MCVGILGVASRSLLGVAVAGPIRIISLALCTVAAQRRNALAILDTSSLACSSISQGGQKLLPDQTAIDPCRCAAVDLKGAQLVQPCPVKISLAPHTHLHFLHVLLLGADDTSRADDAEPANDLLRGEAEVFHHVTADASARAAQTGFAMHRDRPLSLFHARDELV